MKQTRKIEISQRVFTSKDLVRIANVLDKQRLDEQHTKKPFKKLEYEPVNRKDNWAYEVNFEDGTSVEEDSPKVFEEEWLSLYSRPVEVTMSYTNYSENRRRISVSLSHGDDHISFRNQITVSGSDEQWVNANFQLLKDCVASVRPQTSWFVRHPNLLLNLVALGLGSSINLIVFLIVSMYRGPVPRVLQQPPPWFAAMPPLAAWVFVWVTRWLSGFFWGAWAIRRWLLDLWPSVEFDFGQEHFKIEKKKRERLNAVWVLAIAPTLVSLFYDLAKAIGIIKF